MRELSRTQEEWRPQLSCRQLFSCRSVLLAITWAWRRSFPTNAIFNMVPVFSVYSGKLATPGQFFLCCGDRLVQIISSYSWDHIMAHTLHICCLTAYFCLSSTSLTMLFLVLQLQPDCACKAFGAETGMECVPLGEKSGPVHYAS